eukprot:COSAG01_NODE_17653_length_1134_cov_0.757488_2_plen_29_part_01
MYVKRQQLQTEQRKSIEMAHETRINKWKT